MDAATQSVDWKLVTRPFQIADPATLVSALKDALALKPVAVVFSGVPDVVWKSVLPAYQKAGVAIIPIAVGSTNITGPVKACLDCASDTAMAGKLLANWVVADSNGSGKLLIATAPDIGAFTDMTAAIKSTLSSGCDGCSQKELDLTVAQLTGGGATPAIVSALQRDTSIDYVSLADGAYITGLPAALKAAGINKVKIVGSSPSLADLQGLVTGDTSAWTLLPAQILGWMAVDVALRTSAGLPVFPDGGGVPQGLLTAQNIGTPNQHSSDLPKDIPAQFKALWGVG